MEAMTGVIVSNGSISDYSGCKRFFRDAGLVICADGGASHILKLGVKPDILLGDFDSISPDDMRLIEEGGTEVIRFPAQKDMTDTEIAAELAVERGCRKVIFLGCIGSRMDHTLSNILLLKRLLDAGVHGVLADEKNEITLIKDGIKLVREEDARVSLIPISGRVEGVTTSGLYYPLDRATLEIGSTRGVSNEFTGNKAEVSIEEGLLLVIKSRD